MRHITRTVWILSIVSLLTDVASEMLYPVMPVYLNSIGFSVVLIGVLEGFAEAIAGVSKGYFGKRSDISGRRLPFVRLGYGLSALSKPMMALWAAPAWVFLARATDRLGKGVRTAARDALLSDEATLLTRGRVFGFHRSMDTLGAVLGPLAALVFLYLRPGDYRMLFFLAFFPGALAMGFTWLLRDKNPIPKENRTKTSFFSFLKYWKESPASYRKLVAGLLLFTLFNSSDMFLLLQIKQAGLSDTATIGVYVFYNLVLAAFAYPIGVIADRLGLRNIFIAGLLVFAIVYCGMAFFGGLYTFLFLFLLYGIYAAATEGIAKAWISNITDKKDTATAIGTFTAFQSICTLLASSITGLLWHYAGPTAAFVTSAIAAIVVAAYLLSMKAPIKTSV
ncbi:MAG: MFS transporter [Sphingobacteriales bacterium]|nr:MAG: MFS transporter [Sphingobacteriales bacterium]